MADLVVRARTVWTLDPERPRAEAVGIRDGRILAVGNVFEVRQALARPGTKPLELDLEGATVVPGLTDAHGHLEMLGRASLELDLSRATSGETMAAAAAVRAALVPAGSWIRGRAWDQNRFPGGAFPDRRALDAAVPGHPVVLERVDGHACLANGVALALAGLGKGSGGDPPGGHVVRDAEGEPTGVLLDSAMALVLGHVPPPTREQLELTLAEAAGRCAEAGLVGVHDAGADLDVIEALRRLDARGALPLRVYAMARFGDPRFAEILEDGPVRVGRVTTRAAKLFLDGALGSRGAALFDDYSDAPGQRGLLTGPERLAETLADLMRHGFQPALHAIGDRAAAAALDALEAAGADSGRADLRPRLEHAQVLRASDVPRLASLGVVASVQPVHAVSDKGWAQARLGPLRIGGAYLLRTLALNGAKLALGSDFPIESPDPRRGLWAACTRGGWRVPECLDRPAALAGFTTGPAWAAFEEGEAGRLAPGMRADLTAFDLDVLAEPPEALLEAQVELVMVEGRATYSG